MSGGQEEPSGFGPVRMGKIPRTRPGARKPPWGRSPTRPLSWLCPFREYRYIFRPFKVRDRPGHPLCQGMAESGSDNQSGHRVE